MKILLILMAITFFGAGCGQISNQMKGLSDNELLDIWQKTDMFSKYHSLADKELTDRGYWEELDKRTRDKEQEQEQEIEDIFSNKGK